MDGNQKALLLFSGGQDSSICLAYALKHYEHIETIGFDYGQRHNIELACRLEVRAQIQQKFPQWAKKLGADHMLDMPALAQIGGTALIEERAIIIQENNLPSTFVPGRNLLFLNYAAALAYRRNISVLVGGMCETDFSGYPDCRRDTLDKLGAALHAGMAQNFTIDTPLMHMDKAQSWAFAHELGDDILVELICEHSHSCYLGVRDIRYKWGYGCNACPACELRARGFATWQASKP